jgi:hypothetical protein
MRLPGAISNQQSTISNQQLTIDNQHSKSRELLSSWYAPRKPLPPHTTSFFCAAEAIGEMYRAVIAGAVIAGAVIAGAVIAGAVIAGAVIAGAVIAGAVIAGAVIAGAVQRGYLVSGHASGYVGTPRSNIADW